MNTTGKLISFSSLDERMVELDQRYFPRPWSHQDWQGMNVNHHLLYGWFEGEKLIGFALFQFIVGDETAHLLKILIVPEARGTQTSQSFWSHIIKSLNQIKVKNIFLEVEDLNLQAVRFYEKQGFQLLKMSKGFYSDGKDARLMQLMLDVTRV